MRSSYGFGQGGIVECGPEAAQVFVFVNPDEEERRHLTDDLLVDAHTLASALDPDELPRLELEPGHLALILKKPKPHVAEDRFVFKVNSIGLFLFADRLVVVVPDEAALLEPRFFASAHSLHDVLLSLIYRVIVHFLEHLRVINMISDDLEQKINASLENRYLIDLFSLEKGLVYYLNAINANTVVIERLRSHPEKLGLHPEDRELLEDIVIENTQCFKQAEIYSSILANLMDARVSIVSNNLNVLMKTLNIITIGIMVPTFVVSAFSMNVSIPLSPHPAAFWLILALAGCSVFAVLAVWRLRRW